MVAILLKEVVNILEVVPVYHTGPVVTVKEELEGLCAAAGFLYQVACWMEMIIICWIALYLLTMLVLKCNATAINWKQESCGLAVMFILPFLFNWIPFNS